MPYFLEQYTIPHDLPPEDIVYNMRRMNRRSDARALRCGYSLGEGTAWCLTEAPDASAVREGMGEVTFALTLDEVQEVDPSFDFASLGRVDRIFDPSHTSPAEVGDAPRR